MTLGVIVAWKLVIVAPLTAEAAWLKIFCTLACVGVVTKGWESLETEASVEISAALFNLVRMVAKRV